MWAFSIAIVLFGLAGSALAQQNAPETVVPVGTTVAVRKPIARTADFVGRVQAIDRVEYPGAYHGIPGAGAVQGRRYGQDRSGALQD